MKNFLIVACLVAAGYAGYERIMGSDEGQILAALQSL
jgi:hypothetical protein